MKIISGVFFQEYEGIRIGFIPIKDAVVLVEPQQLKNMFTGVILPNEQFVPPRKLDGYINEPPEDVNGYIFDAYGFAYVLDYQESETKISFTKKYEHRPDYIFYSFELIEGTEWLGTWIIKQGDEIIDKGYTSCILVPISDQMFNVGRFLNTLLSNRL